MSQRVFIHGPSYSSVPWWLMDEGISSRAIHLWCILYRISFEDNDSIAELTYAELSRLLGECKTSVRRGLAELVGAGSVVIHPVLDNGFQSANRYELLFDGGVPVEEGGARGRQAGVPPGDSNSIPKELKKDPPSAGSEYSEEFETLWKAYPKTIGKKATHTKYLATLKKGADHPSLLSATLAYAKRKEGTEERYIQNGATFFGPQEPWRDYVTQPVVAPSGDTLEASSLWNFYYNDPNHLTPLPPFPDPFVSPEGRPYTSEPRGPYLIRFWADER